MPIKLNLLLREAGIDPVRVRLVRHQDNRASTHRSPYVMWRDYPADFMAYQSWQSSRTAASLEKADFWAVFVVTPARETLFVGLYEVGAATLQGGGSNNDDVRFELTKSDKLEEYDEKLVIEWGAGYLAWHQRADKQDKLVLELRTRFVEEAHPGHLHFVRKLSEIESLPIGWKAALTAVQGVYVLTCPKTELLYVGSATGQGGFFERWCQHARTGGDALQLQIREPSDYQVSILEVAASNADPDDVKRLEHLWMRKLQTVEMGLNSGARRPPRTQTPEPVPTRAAPYS